VPRTLTFAQIHNYPDEGDGILIPVLLTAGDRRAKFVARVDTGAAFCIFNRAHGEALGLDIEAVPRHEFRTAAGNFFAYPHNVSIKCLDFEVESVVYFAENPDFDRNVLGRDGWIRKFRLGIIDYDSLLYLSRYDD